MMAGRMMAGQHPDNVSDSWSPELKALIPTSLDDVIRWHRENFQLRLTTEIEIFDLYKTITANEPRDVMDAWNLITLVKPGAHLVFLIGEARSKKCPRITSDVIGIDLNHGFLNTRSGSLYQLGNQKIGPPTQQELYLICATFHNWGFGAGLGVPEFFY